MILEMLRRQGVKGCIGKIVEYYGPGVKSLSATDRETICNMGTELGATTSIFPSDENTRTYLKAQGRGEAWVELSADAGAEYDEYDEIDLSKVEPLIAKPSSPGNVVTVREVAGLKVDQVIVGSSVNSSFRDLMVVAKIVEGRHASAWKSFHVNPGSRQVIENIASQGGVLTLLRAGGRIHEPGCLVASNGAGAWDGPGEPADDAGNFPGRSGTKDDRVYLCSPETIAAAALKGVITPPRDLGKEMEYPEDKGPRKISRGRYFHHKAERGTAKNGNRPGAPTSPRSPPSRPSRNHWNPRWFSVVGDNISTDNHHARRQFDIAAPVQYSRASSGLVYSQIDPSFT